ncbi:hypothetical protein [Paenibacillus wynnii]|uniref:hypothetical protein n=1 Tax=Paenibacillus wynnii TaxID=268407 RepID=UPI00279290A6|nr:hypothetical protein [Paenibacillus wynnii]MDQ0195032.1 hypothetical protein [Paenibacillus wynnii]
MGNKIKQEIDRIEIPRELHERSKMGVQKAKIEISTRRKWSNVLAVAASLLILLVSFNYIREYMEPSPNNESIHAIENGAVQVPTLKLPENTVNEIADMIGLIVYNGKIYTQTATEIDSEDVKDLVGEKLGTTIGNIDEWSQQAAFDIELASTIGKSDVYAVIGYDKDFRIMTYSEHDGIIYSEFFECLNGITVRDGGDVFGKLNMIGNVVRAQYQIYSDWYNSVDQFYPIENVDLLNTFVEELNAAIPHLSQSVEKELGDFRNNDEYRQMTIQLKDGSKVSLVIIKDGYVYYGFSSLYFKMDPELFDQFWEELTQQ